MSNPASDKVTEVAGAASSVIDELVQANQSLARQLADAQLTPEADAALDQLRAKAEQASALASQTSQTQP